MRLTRLSCKGDRLSTLIVLPGGGYWVHADHEGEALAPFFLEKGVDVWVLKYPLASEGARHPAMLESACAAVRLARHERGGVVGIMGFSAGGHLASHVLTSAPPDARPDFGVLCYPVISLTEHGHEGSAHGLLGEGATMEQRESLSTHHLVTEQTPPAFLWHTEQDEPVPVENSLMFASALRKNKVPFELHVFEEGVHGIGMGGDPPHQWTSCLIRWMAVRGWSRPA